MTSPEPPRFLLLLPPPPSGPSPTALQSVYGDTLSQVLKEVATHSADNPKAAILEIALALPHLVGQEGAPRSSLFASTQSIIAGVYGLITRIAAKDGVDVEDQDGVDVRILLVAWSPDTASRSIETSRYGPIISLPTLARCGRAWQYAFGVESHEGEAFVKAFVEAKSNGEDVSRVQRNSNDSCTNNQPPPASSSTTATGPPTTPTRHHHIAIGGTFDHIHIGHKLLLTMTAFAADPPPPSTITIGITGDALLVNKKHAAELEPWTDRFAAVMHFLNSILDFSVPSSPTSSGKRHVSVRDDPGPNGKSMDIHYPSGLEVRCTEIQDPFGPTITDEGISGMVLTAETRAGGTAVNERREGKGWRALELFEVDVLDAEEEGAVREGFEGKLSSTAIREKLARKRKGGGSSL